MLAFPICCAKGSQQRLKAVGSRCGYKHKQRVPAPLCLAKILKERKMRVKMEAEIAEVISLRAKKSSLLELETQLYPLSSFSIKEMHAYFDSILCTIITVNLSQ